MEREILDRIVELIASDDHEMQSLAKAIFILNEPVQEDYLYLDAKQGILKESFPERYISELGRKMRPQVNSCDTTSVVQSNSAMMTSIPIGIFVKNPNRLLKLKPNP